MSSKPKLVCEGEWDKESIKNYTSLDLIKKQLHRGNYSYLARHPEIRAIIRVLLAELIDKNPENIYEFSTALFNCNNSPLLVHKINVQLKRINEQLKKSPFADHDGEVFFSENLSSHSLLSRASIGTDMDNMLRYAMLMRDKK